MRITGGATTARGGGWIPLLWAVDEVAEGVRVREYNLGGEEERGLEGGVFSGFGRREGWDVGEGEEVLVGEGAEAGVLVAGCAGEVEGAERISDRWQTEGLNHRENSWTTDGGR